MCVNVLVVDDSPTARAIMIKAVRMCGVKIGEIYEAENGQEGLGMLENHWIDIALLDINMPIMTGEEMLRKLKRNPEICNMPIIIISSEGSQTRIKRLEKSGTYFLGKPFVPEELRQD